MAERTMHQQIYKKGFTLKSNRVSLVANRPSMYGDIVRRLPTTLF